MTQAIAYRRAIVAAYAATLRARRLKIAELKRTPAIRPLLRAA